MKNRQNTLWNFYTGLKPETIQSKRLEKRSVQEGTCNAYLKDVFRFYLFIEAEYEQYGSLKTLSYNQIIAVNRWE